MWNLKNNIHKLNKFSICSNKLFSTSTPFRTEENQDSTEENQDNKEIEQFPRHKKEIKKRDLLTTSFYKDFLKWTFTKNKIDTHVNLDETESINKELTELSEERKCLKVELQKCKMAIRTVEESIRERKIPREEEFKNITDIKENYGSFFDGNSSDSEESYSEYSASGSNISSNVSSSNDTETNNNSESSSRGSDLNISAYSSFKEVYSYIKEEIRSNGSNWSKLRKDYISTLKDAEESKNKGKRKMDDIEEAHEITSTKKSRNTPTNDFIDDLPTDFTSYIEDID